MKRYTFEFSKDKWEDPNGDWVLFSDVKEAFEIEEEVNKNLKERLEKLLQENTEINRKYDAMIKKYGV